MSLFSLEVIRAGEMIYTSVRFERMNSFALDNRLFRMPPNITSVNIPEQAVTQLTVEELYNKEKYDLSTMKEDDVFKMLE